MKQHLLRTGLGLHTWGHLAFINHDSKVLSEGLSHTEETVVLVGGFGQAHLVRVLGDGLFVGHDGIRFLRRRCKDTIND